MSKDYKKDADKPPVLDAVFIPYRRALMAIAAMKQDMAEKHKLQGAAAPFEEWRKLPNAKRRIANAAARHLMRPWEVNTEDGSHLHIVHCICGLLMALEKHLEETSATAALGIAAPDFSHVLERAKLDLALQGECPPIQIRGPAGADWREPQAQQRHPEEHMGHYWTGDRGMWLCTCGAGRPEACTCPRLHGDYA